MIAKWVIESAWGAMPVGHANYFVKRAARTKWFREQSPVSKATDHNYARLVPANSCQANVAAAVSEARPGVAAKGARGINPPISVPTTKLASVLEIIKHLVAVV